MFICVFTFIAVLNDDASRAAKQRYKYQTARYPMPQQLTSLRVAVGMLTVFMLLFFTNTSFAEWAT